MQQKIALTGQPVGRYNILQNPNSWYPVLGRAIILTAKPAIQPLPPLQVTVQSIHKMRDWA